MTGDAGSVNHYRGANAYPNPINATRRFVITLTQYGTNHHEARDINRTGSFASSSRELELEARRNSCYEV